MLTQEMNVFLTRTGPGTPMGELFRRYWIPALLDSELPERAPPPGAERRPRPPAPIAKALPVGGLGGRHRAFEGPAGGKPAVAELRVGASARVASRHYQTLAGQQLPVGGRGRHRFEP